MNRIKLRRATELVALFVVVLLVTGCVSTRTYVEPLETTQGFATVEATAPVWIHAIDGKEVRARNSKDTRSVRITPGSHEVVVNYRTVKNLDVVPADDKLSPLPSKTHRPIVSAPVTIPINAKPGFSYVIQFEPDAEKKQVLFWVGEFENITPSAAREMKSEF